ncbi:hypothetical protein [Sorangium sp. So ce117]|uniref:hypothetical protein n=1 Tax=Sorangium sp. So ce117 TaxID=3133277 RepID=UPI003F639ABC
MSDSPGPTEAADRRARAFSLLVHAYDQTRRAVAYLRWDEEDADTIAPSLYKGRTGRATAHSDTVAAPGDEAPAAPAAPGAATPAAPNGTAAPAALNGTAAPAVPGAAPDGTAPTDIAARLRGERFSLPRIGSPGERTGGEQADSPACGAAREAGSS